MNFFQKKILILISRGEKLARIVRSVGILGVFVFLIILLIVPFQSSALGDVRAKIVVNVSGLQDYQLHWNDRFPPGSTLMIYAEADDVNHRRLVGVDYIFIIKDSNDNIVDATVYSSRYRDYRSDDFVKYQKQIDENLEDGTYTAEIHIFDLLNDSTAEEDYNNITRSLLNQENDNTPSDITYINRSEIMNDADLMAHQYKKVVQPFYVDKYANKYPTNRFSVENMALNMYDIAPGVPVQVNTTAKNTFYDSGTVSMDLLLDGRTVDSFSSEIGAYGSKDITLNVPTEITSSLEYGNHTIEIVPTSDNTLGLDLSAILHVNQMQIEVPAKFYYSDIQTNKLSVKPNEVVVVTVRVENKGRAGNQSIGLLINNVPIEEKTVYVNSLENKDVNFSVSEKELGEYRVTVNNTNLTKIFFVEAPENVSQQPVNIVAVEEKQTPKIFIVSGLLILVILIYVIRKRFISRLLSDKKSKE
jgi:hypothetical protein